MNINQFESLIIRHRASKNLPSFDHSEGYVDYDTAAWLFDVHFNEPCETYFHNEDDFADYPEGTPERDQWEGREDNWEACGNGYFLNYHDNFIVRFRYARPTYIQTLKWLEAQYGVKIDINSTVIFAKNIRIPHGNGYTIESFEYHPGQPIKDPYRLARTAIKQIIQRIQLRHSK